MDPPPEREDAVDPVSAAEGGEQPEGINAEAPEIVDGEGAYCIPGLIDMAWKVLRKEKPDIIISSGAAVAVPFFYVGKILGIKTMYIEVFDRIDKPTLTGKFVYPVTDRFIVQWEEMKKFYPKAENLGSIF